MSGWEPARQAKDLKGMGAFITNPISLRRRTIASERALVEFPGGILVHTGLPNPGFQGCIKKYAQAWKRSKLPIWVHILINDPHETLQMVQTLEECEGVAAVELEVSQIEESGAMREILLASSGKLPVVVEISPRGLDVQMIETCKEANICALSMATQRGTLPDASGRLVNGRLYGPALFPQTLKALGALVLTGIPIIAAGGIFTRQQADTCLQVGAAAVKFDLALWKSNPLEEVL